MKDFDRWNSIKKYLHLGGPNFHIQDREIWYVHLGVNVGSEQDGRGMEFRRPVLVMKKIGNLFLVLPMTTGGSDSKFYYRLSDVYFEKTSRVILSQVKVLDKARFLDKIGMLSSKDFMYIKQKLKALLL